MKAYIPTIDPESKMVKDLHDRLESIEGITPVLFAASTPDSNEFYLGAAVYRFPGMAHGLAAHKWAIILTYKRLLDSIWSKQKRVLVIQEDANFDEVELGRWASLNGDRYGIIDLYMQTRANHFCPVAFELNEYDADYLRGVIERGPGNLCAAFGRVRHQGPDIFWNKRRPRDE
jgi:hypothetical protein